MPTQVQLLNIGKHIHSIRGYDVMLDRDLASLYGIPTKRINEQVRRNPNCFPEDFMFQLTPTELNSLQSGTSRVTLGQRKDYLPHAFTEAGALMLFSVLKSAHTAEIKVAIIRAFVNRRQVKETPSISNPDFSQLVNLIGHKLDNQTESLVTAIQKLAEAVMVSQSLTATPPLSQSGSKPRSLVPAAQAEPTPNSALTLLKATAEYFNLSLKNLEGPVRIRKCVLPRQIAMYLLKKHADLGFKEIGLYLGGRDHSTVIHAYRKIELELETNSQIRNAVLAIETSFQNKYMPGKK